MNNRYARQISDTEWEITTPLMDSGNYGTPLYLVGLNMWDFTPDEYGVLESAIYMVIAEKYQQEFTCICTGYGLLIKLMRSEKLLSIHFKDYRLNGNIISYQPTTMEML